MANDARASRARAPSKRPKKRTESVHRDANRRTRRRCEAWRSGTCAVLAVVGARRPAPSVWRSECRVQPHLRWSCLVSQRSKAIGEDVIRTQRGAACMEGDADRAKASARFKARRRLVDGHAWTNQSDRCGGGIAMRTSGSRTCSFAHARLPTSSRRRSRHRRVCFFHRCLCFLFPRHGWSTDRVPPPRRGRCHLVHPTYFARTRKKSMRSAPSHVVCVVLPLQFATTCRSSSCACPVRRWS